MSALAATYHIIADQGATFTRSIVRKDRNKRVIPTLNHTARMQVRETYTSESPIIDLTTENDGIQIDGPKGTISILIHASEMESVPAGKYVYDLEIVSDEGIVERLIMGSFTVRPEVTL